MFENELKKKENRAESPGLSIVESIDD